MPMTRHTQIRRRGNRDTLRTLGNRFGDKKLPSRFFIFGIGQNKSGGRGWGILEEREMGSLGNVFEWKMGETALPKSSTPVKPKITVPDKISKDSCPNP